MRMMRKSSAAMEVSSPLRRSVNGSFKTPAPPNDNNDEQERASARRSFMDTSVTSTSVEQCESLELGMKLFRENKFTKDNAFNIPLIDSFNHLVMKHHRAVGSFQAAGYGIEASAKLYGLRVDSVYEKSQRLLTGLGSRRSIREGGAAETDADDGEQSLAVPGTRRKRQKRPRSTVTSNLATINAKLETVPLPDPILAQFRSFFGDISNPKRLLCNKLMDRDGIFNLDPDKPLRRKNPGKVDVKKPHDWSQDEKFTLYYEELKPGDRLRPMYSHYEIKDTPAEEDEEADWDMMQAAPANDYPLSLAFDMDAEVEPLPDNLDDMPACDEADLPDVGELTEDDRAAIMACKGMRPKSVHIRDLRPTEAQHSRLEYSYRPMDKISQYWAGPSHWKIKKPPKVSLVSTASAPKRARRQKVIDKMSAKDFADQPEDLFVSESDAKPRRKNAPRKWENKDKLKLPTDLKLDRSMFNKYSFAPGLPVREAKSDAVQELPIADEYNYDNPVDRSYCSNVAANEDTDTETGTEPGVGEVGEEAPPEAIEQYSMHFAGAPEKIERIVLPFAKRAKVVDMKQLKTGCLHLVTTGGQNATVISFQKLYTALPRLLSPLMRENLSVALAFYALLHITNDHSLELAERGEDLLDFGIQLRNAARLPAIRPAERAAGESSDED